TWRDRMAVLERIGKKGKTYYYDFTIDGKRYRKTVGRNKQKAELEYARRMLEIETSNDATATQPVNKSPSCVPAEAPDSCSFIEYAETRYAKWSKDHKKTWREDLYHLRALRNFFGAMKFDEITAEILDDFMAQRLATPTKHDQMRSPTSVNREL